MKLAPFDEGSAIRKGWNNVYRHRSKTSLFWSALARQRFGCADLPMAWVVRSRCLPPLPRGRGYRAGSNPKRPPEWRDSAAYEPVCGRTPKGLALTEQTSILTDLSESQEG